MRNSITVEILYGGNLKNRIANFLYKRGYFSVSWCTPMFDEYGNEVGKLATVKSGNPKMLWILKKFYGNGKVRFDPYTLV